MNRLLSEKSGMTLTELIITISITGVIFLAVSSFLINSMNHNRRITDNTEVQYQAQFASSFINEMVSQAYGITEKTVSGKTVYVFEVKEKQNDGTYLIKYRYLFLDGNTLSIATHTYLGQV